jgi:hypothetical protein
MGWDISYHPLGENDVSELYFAALDNPQAAQQLAAQAGLGEEDTEHLALRLDEARSLPPDTPFNSGHAFYVAIVTGFLRPHHYIRGGAFSFLADDPVMARYIGDWRTLVPAAYRQGQFDNVLTHNYCAGVYLPYASLQALRRDADSDPHVRAMLEQRFSDGRLAVFWQAVDAALAQGMGLMEASEVVEPNPLDLNASRSRSRLLNCQPDGALLYAEAALAQLGDALASATPQPAATRLSPLSLRALLVLFMRPTSFFSSHGWLQRQPEALLVVWLCGISYAMARVGKYLGQAGAGKASALASWLGESWAVYWLLVLAVGALNGVILRWLGGWWFRLRLRWCGAGEVPVAEARLVYVYQDLVQSLPLLLALCQTALYAGPAAAHQAAAGGGLLMLLFTVWSCVVSYRAACSFAVDGLPVRFWFLWLPAACYVLLLSLLMAVIL